MSPYASAAMEVRTRRGIAAIVASAAIAFGALAWRRYDTFHNETFDLAFYARMAWGEAHFDGWNPIVDAHVRGLHLSWILVPLGHLGSLLGQVPTLLFAQAIALAGAAIPLGRMAGRYLGDRGALVAAAAWVLHPNVSQVATNEFHPGSVAALPLAFAIDALDRRSARDLVLGTLGVLACREDLGLVTTLLGAGAVLAARGRPDGRALRRTGTAIAVGSAAYVAFFVLVLHPRFAPAHGSLELHFGRYGSSAPEVLLHLLTHPSELAEHLGARHRVLYLPIVTAPFALLPLARPHYLLLATPVLAMNLVSVFPGTTDLDSHYLTPALAPMLASAIRAAAALPVRPLLRLAPLAICAAIAHAIAGGTPLSTSFEWDDYRDDERARGARAIVARIPPSASVQAPDAILPHLAERLSVRRAPPPETNADFVVLDLAHRRRFLHDEDLLRTTEEPIARAWLARDDHALVLAAGDYALLERGRSPREGVGMRAVVGAVDPDQGTRLCACLALLGATTERDDGGEDVLVLDLVARDRCDDDLALRIGSEWRPRRVDLLADGLLSPAHFRRGDHIRSRHAIDGLDLERLRIGALRSSGARPEHEDPMSVPVTVSRR